MLADVYNQGELDAGRLTREHVALLNVKPGETLEVAVRRFQGRAHLTKDSKAGKTTRLILCAPLHVPAETCIPVERWRERDADISDGFGSKRESRLGYHPAFDLMFLLEPGEDAGGNPVYTQRNGMRWVCPTHARAAAAGEIQFVGGNKRSEHYNGERCWIDHGNGWRTGYLHLDELEVEVGQVVECGQRLAPFAPRKVMWPAHLHWVLSPFNRLIYTDPAPWYERGLLWQR